MDVSAKDVFDIIHNFFIAASGGDDEAQALVREEGDQPSLLRTACMGNPERTMQGELFAYLKSLNHLRPVLEYRHHRLERPGANSPSPKKNLGNSIDIMVFDRSYRPIVAVELKHHSRQQGTLHRLNVTLDNDRERLRTLDIPSVQVGLYTELQCLGEHRDSRERYEDFRFITAYAYTDDKQGGYKRKTRRESDKIDASALCSWARDNFDNHKCSFSGRAQSFKTPHGAVVQGRVHYLVGLGMPGERAESIKLRRTVPKSA